MRSKFFVLALPLLLLLSGCLTEQSVEQQVEEANYCSAKEDCVALNFPSVYCFILADSLMPPFLVNKAEEAKITNLLGEFCKPSESYVGMVGIMEYCDDPLLECQAGKCVGSCPQNLGEYCENSNQCQIYGQCFDGYPVCEENKCGCSDYHIFPFEQIEFLRNFSLEESWTREEKSINPFYELDDEVLNPAHFTFENDDILCKKSAMTGYPKTGAWYSFSFYKNGYEPKGMHQIMPFSKIYLDDYVVLFFADCSDELPAFIQNLIDGLGGSKEGYEIEMLREYSLPSGWAMEEKQAGDSIASFQFSSDEEICKHQIMGAPLEEPGVSFLLYFEEKWTEQDYSDNALASEAFNQCLLNHPDYNPDVISSALSTAEVECREQTGLRTEPDFDTRNYSVYVTGACQDVLLIEQIKANLQRFN